KHDDANDPFALNDPSVLPPIVRSGPDNLFRVHDVRVGEGTARGEMDRGDWSSFEGHPIGVGALGVMADDVTGYALATVRRPATWMVSTEISIDAFSGLLEASSVRMEARVVQSDSVGGFATAKIFDQHNALVAVATQRGRWIPLATSGKMKQPPPIPGIPEGDLGDMLNASTRVDGTDLVLGLICGDLHANVEHTMQGGITIAAADVAATAALAVEGMPPLVTASLRIGYTRGVLVGDSVEYRAVTKHRGRSLGIAEVTASVAGKVTAVVHVVASPLATSR
ncbi:MAG: hypothetical protein JWP10_439, partial [Nocardioidaceae bacterium]|nr:hypothetical protein [Nocardioidaceae bacterium]